jgi:hypothetical protein
MQSQSMATARVADGAKCLAGKKDSGDFSVWSSSSFSGAAFSFIAARPLVAELGRAAGSGIEHLSNEVVLYRRSNKFADKFTHI